ncbi:hypothetical protein C8Q74DRAFT_1211811 [Fomes fomentarius]|nr:hypothetical protein C8Q74DRAFT_1211811 [Fomes fomentarius]
MRRSYDSPQDRAVLDQKDREIRRYRRRLRECSDELKGTQAEAQECRERHDAALERVRQLEAQASKIEHDAKARIIGLEQSTARLQKDLQATTALLDTRTAELKDAQAFLSNVDNVADSEVQHIIERLNSTIFQTAATIADAPAFQCEGQKDASVVDNALKKLSEGSLGPCKSFESAIRTIGHGNSILVQTAIQAVMTSHARWLATSWDFGLYQYDPDDTFYEVYAKIRGSEQQSVAGKWRAMARMAFRAMAAEESGVERHAKDIAKSIAYALIACGATQIGTRSEVYESIKRDFNSGLQEIIRFALEFQRLSGERVVSRDLILIGVDGEALFDPAAMEDEWTDPKNPSSAASGGVLCTTQLGLVREEKKAGKIERAVLVKPKVALTGMLQHMRE